MEDIGQQINKILSDPQSLQQLQSMASALGLGGSAPAAGPEPAPEPAPTPQPDLSGLAGALGALGGQQDQGQNSLGALAGLADNAQLLGMVTRLAPLLGQAGREDDSTRLLRALRPLLGAERQKKVDEALKILQMLRLLPLLKESGVFSGLLAGLM